MLVVEHGFGHAPSVKYILDTILVERLGLPYTVRHSVGTDQFRLSANDRTLYIPSVFLKSYVDRKTPSVLPGRPLESWDSTALGSDIRLTDQDVPVIFGQPTVTVQPTTIELGIDIFGSAFFMLSRYEETINRHLLDQQNRFPLSASIASQSGLIRRPIVDEYVEILWSAMQRLWPELRRHKRSFRMLTSCDVDRAYSHARISLPLMVRQVSGDVIYRKRPDLGLSNIVNYLTAKMGSNNCQFDPYYSRIDWMMDVAEKAGQSIAFYFISGHSSNKDGRYHLHDFIVRRKLREIYQRGHEIGLHPSFNTFRDPSRLGAEAETLRTVLKEEGLHQAPMGGRQHYLRWDPSVTPQAYEKAGLTYDTTLSFAEHAGFRCGTCHEYTFYDTIEDRPLALRERPLIVMEVSVISKGYMGLGIGDRAIDYMAEMKRICRKFDGDFTLLWHNDVFFAPRHEEFFKTLLAN